ncbi:MAG TPA: hypothetical protein VEI02_10400, partial [Planctomycetota bacterium]|nr:hypothetical protein [Planctomycetota bacterium]
MAKRTMSIVLAALVLAPCAGLAIFGVRALAEDAERAETRLRAQAETALRAAQDALRREAAALVEGPADAIRFAADADGRLTTPVDAASSRPVRAPDDDALLASIAQDVARLERTGGVEAAAERLRGAASIAAEPDAAAWAAVALGAVQRRAGDLEGARETWRGLVAAHPDVRDARGLLRAHGARLLLLETSDAPDAAEAVALFEDAADDAAGGEASAYVAERARELADAALSAKPDPALRARFDRASERERARRRLARFRAAW